MKLSINGIKEQEAWKKAGIALPGYDVETASEKAKENPVWVHFGIGNIFRVFIGGIADGLLEEEVLDRGITCVETFDYDVVDKIYDPYDNLGLSVIVNETICRDLLVKISFRRFHCAALEDCAFTASAKAPTTLYSRVPSPCRITLNPRWSSGRGSAGPWD